MPIPTPSAVAHESRLVIARPGLGSRVINRIVKFIAVPFVVLDDFWVNAKKSVAAKLGNFVFGALVLFMGWELYTFWAPIYKHIIEALQTLGTEAGLGAIAFTGMSLVGLFFTTITKMRKLLDRFQERFPAE